MIDEIKEDKSKCLNDKNSNKELKGNKEDKEGHEKGIQ
jgi:hypothetical protein